jgi:hypothetical protein
MPNVEHEMLTLLEYIDSRPVFNEVDVAHQHFICFRTR